jgi:hypothetical protein
VLPDNYAWLLLYFSSYAALHPLELETEVINIEIYITSLMPSFFGKQCRLVKHLAIRTPKNTIPTPQYGTCRKNLFIIYVRYGISLVNGYQ